MGEQGAVDAGEGVTAACGGEPGASSGNAVGGAVGCRNERVAALEHDGGAGKFGGGAYPAEGFCVDILAAGYDGVTQVLLPGFGGELVHDAQEAFELCGVRGEDLVGAEVLTGCQVFCRQVAGARVEDGGFGRVEQVAVLIQRVVARARSAGPDGDPLQGGGAAEVDGFGVVSNHELA